MDDIRENRQKFTVNGAVESNLNGLYEPVKESTDKNEWKNGKGGLIRCIIVTRGRTEIKPTDTMYPRSGYYARLWIMKYNDQDHTRYSLEQEIDYLGLITRNALLSVNINPPIGEKWIKFGQVGIDETLPVVVSIQGSEGQGGGYRKRSSKRTSKRTSKKKKSKRSSKKKKRSSKKKRKNKSRRRK